MEVQFYPPLVVQFVFGKENTWRLWEPFRVDVDGASLSVPRGFTTDFASIPKMFWHILSPVGPYAPAAVLHDYLYRLQPCSRDRADRIFLAGMESLAIDEETRDLMYRMVARFGQAAWDRHGLVLNRGAFVDTTA